MLNLRALFRDASLFASTTMISSAISGFLGLALARVLAPEVYGVYQSIRLIQQFSNYVQLGVPWSMQQDIAIARDASGSNWRAAQPSINQAATFVVLATLVSVTALVSLSLMVSWPFRPVMTILVAAMIVGYQVYSLGFMVLTGRRKFLGAGGIDIATSVVNLVVTLGLALRLGLEGVLIGQILWAVLGVGLISHFGSVRFAWNFNRTALLRHIRYGVQFSANGFLMMAYKSIDRFVILAFLGTAALGFYGIGLLLAGYFELVAAAIGRALLPHVASAYSARENMEDIRGAVTTANMVIASLVPVFSGLGALTLPVFVHLALPKYVHGIVAGQILVFGSSFAIAQVTAQYFFAAVSKLYRTYPVQIASLIASATISLVSIWVGAGIAGVAVGSLVAHLVASVGLLGYAYSHYEPQWMGRFRFLIRVHVPAFYVLGVFVVLALVWPGFSLLSSALRDVVFTGACLPLLWQGARYLGLRLPVLPTSTASGAK